MKFVRPLTAVVAALGVAAWLAAPHVFARQAAPGAPADLSYLVNGSALSLTWTHATGPFTHYLIDVGVQPGVPFLQFATSSLPANPSKMPEALAAIANPSAPAGNYYVAVHGVNGTAVGPASPEININLTGGCVVPGTPTNLTAIVRGTSGWFAWNPGPGGAPSSYILQASTQSGASFAAGLLGQAPFTSTTFNVGLPGGTYFLRVYATTACGTSGFSNEVSVTAGVNTPATTPNPPSGRIPEFDFRAAIAQFQQQAINQGLLPGSVSCPSRPGFTDSNIEARKVNLNGYINYLVDSLRTIDRRFGYNAKPTRAFIPAIVAGDEVAYHYGFDAFEQSPNVYVYDLLGGHCTFGNETASFRPFYDEFARWTSAGRF